MIPAIYLGLAPGYRYDLETVKLDSVDPAMEPGIKYELSIEFEDFFKQCTGSEPWSVQRAWARRVLSGYSFAAIAPTGVGKTVFGIVMALFKAEKGGKSLIIVPTSLLVHQALERAEWYMKRRDLNLQVIAYSSRHTRKEREETIKKIRNGAFHILIVTNQFLARRHEILKTNEFSFIFVDDVDSLLKNSRNVDRLLELLGFTREEIMEALRKPGIRQSSLEKVLMLSTATGRPGPRTILFRRLLSFDIGVLRAANLRNISDIAVPQLSLKALTEIVKKMGCGGLVFARNIEQGKTIARTLSMAGFKAKLVEGSDPEAIEKFKSGEYCVLVGVAKPYGVLVRGIDLPETVRYCIFYEVPRYEVAIDSLKNQSSRLLSYLLLAIGEKALAAKLLRDEGKYRSQAEKKIIEAVRGKEVNKTIPIIYRDGKPVVCLPDISTYIQGSGRTSRLYPGGMSKGASFLMDKEELLAPFIKRASAREIEFNYMEYVNLETLKREIDQDRRKIIELKGKVEAESLVKPLLFIVESPNKARTISKFFGKPGRRIIEGIPVYEFTTGNLIVTVIATGGHIVDLTTSKGYHGVLLKNGYTPVYTTLKRCGKCNTQFIDGDRCPRCGSTDVFDARKIISLLRRLAFEMGSVYIGTDPDVEGEKIAWDVSNLIHGFARQIMRAEFHEVTRRAILQALEKPRELSFERVKAQIVRRIEDRWIGFELSQELQRRFRNKNLSAGRAQTPALGWILERYRLAKQLEVQTVVTSGQLQLRIKGKHGDEGETKIYVEVLGEEEESLPPPPPFTTSEMLREASRILRMPATRTMAIAQNLFEAGLITYHRTDSTRVSDAGLRIAKTYLGGRFKPRRWHMPGAHECIRPTKPLSPQELVSLLREGVIKTPVKLKPEHIKLYSLIFKRFIASQDRQVKIVRQKARVKALGETIEVDRIVEVKSRGWIENYPYLYRVLPRLAEGASTARVKHVKVRKANPYTQGELISLMKQKGIGRPSTYAVIISKILQRKYVRDINGYLIPTRTGYIIYNYLVKKYPDLISEERTRNLEEKMEMVESGDENYQKIIDELYHEIKTKLKRGP